MDHSFTPSLQVLIVTEANANSASITTSFQTDEVDAAHGDVLPGPSGGIVYKRFRNIGTAQSPKTVTIQAGATVTFAPNDGGVNSQFEHSTIDIPGDATVVVKAGVVIGATSKFVGTGSLTFEGALNLQSSDVEFRCGVTFAANTILKQAPASGRRLLAVCNSPAMFVAAAVNLGAGSTIEGCNIGTVTSFIAPTPILIAAAGTVSANAFITLVAGGTGVVTITGGSYASMCVRRSTLMLKMVYLLFSAGTLL